jgi:hypothetical protein
MLLKVNPFTKGHLARCAVPEETAHTFAVVLRKIRVGSLIHGPPLSAGSRTAPVSLLEG